MQLCKYSFTEIHFMHATTKEFLCLHSKKGKQKANVALGGEKISKQHQALVIDVEGCPCHVAANMKK